MAMSFTPSCKEDIFKQRHMLMSATQNTAAAASAINASAVVYLVKFCNLSFAAICRLRIHKVTEIYSQKNSASGAHPKVLSKYHTILKAIALNDHL